MVQALSNDIRKRIAKAVDGGLSRNKAAKRFDVAVSTVVKLMNHIKETGSIAPKKIGGYRKVKLAAHEAQIKALVASAPDATLDELVAALAGLGIVTSRSSLDRFFAKIGWSFKKNPSRIRAGQVRRQGRARRLG
jgi:transposase